MSQQPKCALCGEAMPAGEEMFKFHGYSGACPKPPLPSPAPTQQRKEQETADWLDYWELDESTGDYKNDTMRAFGEGWQAGRSSLESENAELRAWKESQIAVTPDYQEIGRLLDIGLGQSIADKIIPRLKSLRELLKEAGQLLDWAQAGDLGAKFETAVSKWYERGAIRGGTNANGQ